jgi:hypothetical protein
MRTYYQHMVEITLFRRYYHIFSTKIEVSIFFLLHFQRKAFNIDKRKCGYKPLYINV